MWCTANYFLSFHKGFLGFNYLIHNYVKKKLI